MIDSHCHLTADQFSTDQDAVIANAYSVGVTTLLCIANDVEDSKKCIDVAKRYEHQHYNASSAPQIFCTIGVHPHEAKHWHADSYSELEALLGTTETIRAIGEIGLDYHYELSDRQVQQQVLQQQLQLAKVYDLPVVLHNRDSWVDLWHIIQEQAPKKAVLHCCTEPWEHAKLWLDQGYLLSFTGICTYKNADVIRDVIARCPLEKLMVETDAPYLAPVPYRGKRNEPSFLPAIVAKIAEIKGCTPQEVITTTTKTTQEFFTLS